MRLSLFVSSLAFALLAACGGSRGVTERVTTTSPRTASAPVAAEDADASCPVAIAGTSVTVEDTDTGASLVFVTTGDAAELRTRVAAMAAAHNEQHSAMGPLPTGDEPGGGHDHHAHHDMAAHQHAGDTGGLVGVHSGARAEEIRDGARLIFVVAPADLAQLQSELRTHAQHLSAGTCEMDH